MLNPTEIKQRICNQGNIESIRKDILALAEKQLADCNGSPDHWQKVALNRALDALGENILTAKNYNEATWLIHSVNQLELMNEPEENRSEKLLELAPENKEITFQTLKKRIDILREYI